MNETQLREELARVRLLLAEGAERLRLNLVAHVSHTCIPFRQDMALVRRMSEVAEGQVLSDRAPTAIDYQSFLELLAQNMRPWSWGEERTPMRWGTVEQMTFILDNAYATLKRFDPTHKDVASWSHKTDKGRENEREKGQFSPERESMQAARERKDDRTDEEET